ncbi:MAG: LamG domain-containing protein, partial [Sedimentisphaerales bacterium]
MMCRKLIYLVSVVLVLNLASYASAELVAHWKLDEGSGDTAFDSSGNNYHGTLVNNPVWVAGKLGGALDLEAGGYVAIQEMNYLGGGFPGGPFPELSVCAWIRTSSSGNQFIVSFDRNEYYRLSIATTGSVGAGEVGWHVYTDAGQMDYPSTRRVDDGEWHHVGGVYDNGTATIYIDGEPEPSVTQGTTWGRNRNVRYGFIGRNSEATAFNGSSSGNPLDGPVDDVRIYHNALTQQEIIRVMKGISPEASNPNPANEQTDVVRDVTLRWTPGIYAPAVSGHKVYFSENFTDVNEGIGGISQDANSYTPAQLLDFGKTYYWRVDEVNGPPDYTVYPGEVWQFTAEPFTYPIENITATASSQFNENT